GGAHRRDGDAVIAVDARDELRLLRLAVHLPVVARELARRLVRLGARRGEVDGRDVRVGDVDETLGETHRRLVGGADIGGREGESLHLLRGGCGELLPAVTDIDVPQTREAVDDLPPVGGVEEVPLRLDDEERRPVIAHMVERMDDVTAVDLEELRCVGHLRACWNRAAESAGRRSSRAFRGPARTLVGPTPRAQGKVYLSSGPLE